MKTRTTLRLLVLAVLLGTVVSLFASASPDGLERVMADLHITVGPVRAGNIASPLPDYQVPGVHNGSLSGSTAGLIGTLIVLGLGWGLAHLLAVKRGNPDRPGSAGRSRS